MTYALTVFNFSGKNYLGNVVTFGNGESVNIPGVGTVNSSSNFYVVVSPCEMELELKEVPGASNHIALKKMMPIIPGKLCSGNADTAYFAFPKATTVLSNITNATINGDLITAYRQMSGCTKGG